MFGHSGSDSRKLCNSETVHVLLLDHRAALTSRALLFPLFLSLLPPEVIVDRRHGWVMSVLSLGDLGVLRGLVRLGSSSRGEDGKWWWQRGKEQLAVVLLCLFFHMSALKREMQDVDGWVCVTKKSFSMSVSVYGCI